MFERSSRRSVLAGVAAIATAGCLGGSDGDIESDTYGDWFRGANNFEGTVDRTDRSEVTVAVGAGDGFAFDPAAVRVSTGTTIRWEWTGRGGQHNVVAADGTFESEYYLEEGNTFEHTFEEPGVYKYHCTPHQTQGMLGVIEVVE